MVSYDKIDVLYPGKLGNRSEARASDLRSYPGLWWKRIKLRLYEGNENEYSPRTCSVGRPPGVLYVPTHNSTCGVDELDMLLWQRSSNLSDLFFVAILLLLSIEPTTPVPSRVASHRRERPFSYNGGYNSSEMAGASPVDRRTRTTRRHLPSTCGRHCSTEHTLRLGFWSLLLVAAHAPHRRHLPSTCGRLCSS